MIKKGLKISTMTLLTGIVILIVSTTLFVNCSAQFGAKSKGAYLNKIENSPQYQEGKFHNSSHTEVSTDFKLGRMLKFFSKGNKVPSWSLPVQKLVPEDLQDQQDSTTQITWFGHSALLVEMDSKKIFIDPMLGEVPAPHPLLGSKRFNDTLPMDIDNIPNLDVVLISHDHYDHLDLGSIRKLKNKVEKFYVPLGVAAHLISWGVEKEKIVEFDWWDEITIDGIKIASTPARHFSGRGLFNRNSTLWCSWVIEGSRDRIFFSGDSGYGDHFKEIGEKYGPFDFTMMECGQYDEQWSEIHMMPEETVQAHLDLKGKWMMPIHWGSFKLALHDWDDPVKRVVAAAEKNKVSVSTPVIGEPIIIGNDFPQSPWWKK